MKNTENFNLKDFKTSKRLLQSFLIAFGMTAISAGVGIVIWMILGAEQGRMLDFLVPIMLMFLTSMLTGSKIRTMWMTPFYLFFGVLIVYIFQAQINLKKLNRFISAFLIL